MAEKHVAGGGADKGDFGGLKVAEGPNTKKENVWYLRVTTRYYRHLTEIQNTSPRIEPSPDEPHTPPSHTTCNALAVLVTCDTQSRMNASVPDYLAPALDLL